MHTRTLLSLTITTLTLASLASGNARAQAPETLEGALKGGSYAVTMRYRHESVSQDNALKDAAADTVLTRLTLNSGKLKGFSGMLEIDNVSTIASDHYDSFVVDEYRGKYSVIADPTYTEVNQANIKYDISPGKSLTAGRQRINHANQRFVGGVAWRQNEQTFDSVTYTQRSGAFELDYSYLWDVNRIFNSSGPSVQASDLDSDSHIVIAKYTQDWCSLSGFAYALDFDNAAALSSMTYGISYAGKVGPVTLNGTVAQQSDYGNGPVAYDAGFLSVDAAIKTGPLTLKAGYDVLGSDNGIKAFQTPLATLHAFQGWADMFLNTPNNGIEDINFSVSGTLKGLGLTAVYHDFSAEEGSASFGDEWDLLATYKINNLLSAQLKYASYDSDTFGVDTDKIWVMLSLAF